MASLQAMSSPKPTKSTFPIRQMTVLALCRICEPIAFMSVFPYVYYMIKSFGITSSDKQIAVYAGMVTSAFAFAEFSTGVIWGRLSDKFGRKPILLMGLFGTGLSMIVFGFAKNLQVALIARALGGLLNGNMGVLQTTVAELVTDDAHRPRAYAIMPFVWCLGGIIGAGLGGCLSDPVRNLGFEAGTIFETYPYLLPNIVCTGVVVFSLIVGVLFMQETHEQKRYERDAGVEAGQWLLGQLLGKRRSGGAATQSQSRSFGEHLGADSEETAALINDDGRFFQSADTTPRTSQDAIILDEEKRLSKDEEVALNNSTGKRQISGVAAAFSGQIAFNIIAYFLLAYHTITFDQLLPVLLSMDESSEPPSLPFKFVGGFELPSSKIGFILSLQGFYQMAAQMILFPFVIKRLGNLNTFRLCTFTYPVLYAVAPYLVLLSGNVRMVALFALLVLKVTLQSFAYPSNMLLLTNNVPSMLVLGAINGVAASSASLARAFGPTLSGLIETFGLQRGYSGLPWWVSSAIAILGAVVSIFMRDMKMTAAAAAASQKPKCPSETTADAPYAGGMTRETIDAHPHHLSPYDEATTISREDCYAISGGDDEDELESAARLSAASDDTMVEEYKGSTEVLPKSL